MRANNVAGDRQADLTVCYPEEHDSFWSREFPDIELVPGMFGENLTTRGLSEETVNIGDRFRAGSAVLRVTPPDIVEARTCDGVQPGAGKETHRMKRYRFLPLAAVALAPLASQTPAVWKMRVDRRTAASDPDAPGDIKFVTMGLGFHATNPQAAVYWNPANTATGAYTLKGAFTLVKPSGHNNY